MTAYYNDTDPFVAAWLRNLIAAGHLPAGDVDERPVQEVQSDDLRPYRQAHFFAGIGGWAHALALAGWGERPVWTGSCPCQPFSAAGRGNGAADTRHLWPAWFRLIRECRPATVFGEQVAAAVGFGWWDAVAADLEGAGYAVGAAVAGAHSVGAPHRRQRLWFVANTGSAHVPRPEQKGGGVRCKPGAPQPVNGLPSLRPWFPLRPDSIPDEYPNGLPRPVGQVKSFGNAIVPQVAAEFVKAYMDVSDERGKR